MTVSASRQLLVDGSPPPPNSRSKRTAEDPLPSPPPKICCTATPNSSVRSRSTAPAAVRPPEPLSINSALQGRERIYIHPLRWVSQHLQLLECHFVRRKAGRESMTRNAGGRAQDEPTRGQQQRRPVELSTEAIVRAADHLLHGLAAAFKISTVRYLLEDHGIRRVGFDLPFRFNQQIVATLQTDGTFSSSSSRSATPTLACLDLQTLESRRNMSIKLSSCNRVNPPIARLRQKQQRRLRPTNEVEDPYIAAVLIALAQGRRHRQDTGGGIAEEATTTDISDSADTTTTRFGPSTPPSLSGAAKTPQETVPYFKVHLLALPATDARSLYFYTARIPSVFLDRFDRPSQYFPSNPVPISYYRIPLNQPTKMIRAMDFAISAVCKEKP